MNRRVYAMIIAFLSALSRRGSRNVFEAAMTTWMSMLQFLSALSRRGSRNGNLCSTSCALVWFLSALSRRGSRNPPEAHRASEGVGVSIRFVAEGFSEPATSPEASWQPVWLFLSALSRRGSRNRSVHTRRSSSRVSIRFVAEGFSEPLLIGLVLALSACFYPLCRGGVLGTEAAQCGQAGCRCGFYPLCRGGVLGTRCR